MARYYFDRFEFIPKIHQLTDKKTGKVRQIEPKISKLLEALLSSSQEVMERHVLIDLLWPSTTTGAENLNRAIFALRNLLNDDSKQPKFIQTIPKVGFRLLVDVEVTSLEKLNTINSESDEKSPYLNVRSKNLVWFALAACVAIVTTTVIWLLPLEQHRSLSFGSVQTVSNSIATESSFSVSPSGTMASVINNESIIANGVTYRPKALNHVLEIDWIDDRFLVYLAKGKGAYQIRKLDIFSGESETIALSEHRMSNLVFDKEVWYLDHLNNSEQHIRYLSLEGQQVATKAKRWPTPFTDQISHFAVSNNQVLVHEGNTFWEVNRDTKNYQHLDIQIDQVNSLTSSPFGWLGVGELGGKSGIYQLGLESTLLLSNPPPSSIRAVEAFGEQLFFLSESKHLDIFVEDLLGKQVSVGNSAGEEVGGILSHDGQWLYFASNRTGSYEVYRQDLHNQNISQLTSVQADWIGAISVSSDLTEFAFHYVKGNHHIGWQQNGKLVNKEVERLKFPLLINTNGSELYASEHTSQVNLSTYDSDLNEIDFKKFAGLYLWQDNEQIAHVDYSRAALVSGKRTLTSIQNLDALSPGQISWYDDNLWQLNGLELLRDNQSVRTLPPLVYVTHINPKAELVVYQAPVVVSADVFKAKLTQ